MIDMLLRNGKPGTGSGHEFMRRRTAINPWPDLRPILEGIHWAIVGDVATRAHMLKRLEQAGYRMISRLAVPGYLMCSPDGTELDVLFGKYPWLSEALNHTGLDPAGYPVVKLPYLIMMKMEAQCSRDLGDLGTMLGWASDADLDEVRTVVKKYMSEDAEDLESLIFIGKKEQEFPPSDEANGGK